MFTNYLVTLKYKYIIANVYKLFSNDLYSNKELNDI